MISLEFAHGVAAGRARGHGREVRAGHPELDGDLPGADVRDAHRDEERADPVGAAQGIRGEAVDQRADAAQPGAQDHPGPLGELALEPLGEPCLVERLARGHEPELDVPVRPAQLLAVEDVARVEVVDLGGEPGGEPGRIEVLDRAHAAPPGNEPGPGRRHVVPERRDEPHPGHDDPAPVVVHRTSFPVRTVAAR